MALKAQNVPGGLVISVKVVPNASRDQIVGLLGDERPRLLPTFRAGSCDKPLFLQLLLRDFQLNGRQRVGDGGGLGRLIG